MRDSDQFKYLMRACHGDSEEYDRILKAEPGKALKELSADEEPEPERPLTFWQRFARWWRSWNPRIF